ncbi:hypothetical protein COY07_05300 [Candidatus Peregrinibacteria bacterium CG_4_10_14_0_2_um_filter_43_11]|nr:MAG: hypothetical protein COY07_05300 [Candidatus Peregrinibacteria bacterium CG_4_10_14_0_2_um_filter_43_11]
MNKLEIRRQIIHILYGPLLVMLYEKAFLNEKILLGLILIGAGTSYMIKRKQLNVVARVLSFFERDHHMENFPGRGILFFTIGAFLSLILFDKSIAYASILMLSAGDAISNLTGRHFGRIKTRLNPKKYIEGTILGILFSIPIAYYFVSNIIAASVASSIAMFLEIPNIRLFGFEIDDNLIIPLAAGFTLSLFT